MTPGLCKEPSFSEMMQEPIIRAVMERDAVRESDLRHLIERLSQLYRAEDRLALTH